MVTRVRHGRSRYAVLETLRAYGRDRLRENGILDECVAAREYFTELAERAAAGMHGADEGDVGRADAARLRQPARRVRPCRRAVGTWTPRFGWSRRCPNSSICESVTSHPAGRSGWSSWPNRAIRCMPPPSVSRHEARGTAESPIARRSLAELADGRVPARGNGRVAYPGDVLADLALYEGDAETALAHYEAEMTRARGDADPIRLVWTLFYVAICHAALRAPENGWPPPRRRSRFRTPRRTPRRGRWGGTRSGLVLKKSEPDRALALFDDAAELAASVHNFWWHGIALMEAASTRAVHGEHQGGGRGAHRGARPLGPGGRLEPAVAQPPLCDAVPRAGRRRRRRAGPAPSTRRRG